MELEKPFEPVNVSNIPTSFPDLVGTEEYIFIGAVQYIGSFSTLKSTQNKETINKRIENKENMSIAHYTAICRKNNAWYEYNDNPNSTHQCKLNSEKEKIFFIGLLIFMKVSK